jgi:endonuclease-3
MRPEEIEAIFQEFYNREPTPKTELEFKNNYTLLVAVVLSAQATDISVNKATKALFEHIKTPEKMLELGEDGLIQYIKSIGLFRSKAKNVMALSKMLVEDYNSTVPESFEELIKLPGVGRKTANVVLTCAFNKDSMPVDTHVFRVAKRIGLSNGKSPDDVEHDLLAIIPKKWLYGAHHWLILHGRYTCVARKPKCNECIISKYCNYYRENKLIYV